MGGTVQYPRGYLRRVYEYVRARGGLCIADEVQTGFARTGETYWGFEAHGVLPDIVVMAKGIGNGYPLGAVVTRPEVARALGQALYFNTFGGNPVGCAVGSAVLDVSTRSILPLAFAYSRLCLHCSCGSSWISRPAHNECQRSRLSV